MRQSIRQGQSIRQRLGRIGFGSAALGDPFTAVNTETAHRAVEAAWAQGVRHFDTAPHHGLGQAEKRLGAALARHPRAEYVLSSKVGRRIVPAKPGSSLERGFESVENRRRIWDFSRDGVLRSLEESLRRLGTDRLDIVYLHDPDGHQEAALAQAAPALAELRDQGVIGAFGVASGQPATLTRFVRETSADVVLVAGRLTLLDSSAVTELLPTARERDVPVVATGVLNPVLLDRTGNNAEVTEVVAGVCEAQGVSLTEAAIAYPLRFPEVAGVLLEMRDAAEVTENLRAASVPVPETLWEALAELGPAGRR